VGTRLVTGDKTPALDGVYKLSTVNEEPTLKVSENIEKITLPGKKKIYRYLNDDQTFWGDAILLQNEKILERIHHPTFPAKKSSLNGKPFEDLMEPVIKSGKIVFNMPPVDEIVKYKKKRFALLNPEYKRFDNPHIYKVGISTRLMETRDNLLTLLKS